MSTEVLTPQILQQLCSSDIDAAVLLDTLSDLEVSAQVDTHESELLVAYYCAYFFALFIHDDLNEARFLAKRIPKDVQANPSIQNAASLLKSLYSRSYPAIYTQLAAFSWPAPVTALVERFAEAFRTRTCTLLSSAYTCISPAAVAYYLGIEVSAGVSTQPWFVQSGWSIDDAGMFITAPPAESSRTASKGDNDGRIHRLTELVTHLTQG
ncbi:hypothetical protein EX30DRAFT_327626 [Ascodesmis nigricans]|uniref:CSN8/PSMD8/EIF3K domain-containing protein n=1 Tax=Ascodesmis nigricans TaxID=341454 RepID=A0A4S2N3Y8_9PEZI|nr:hypothetical protein EX30DRAFT_327626 [Ascodesmis nigricans]